MDSQKRCVIVLENVNMIMGDILSLMEKVIYHLDGKCCIVSNTSTKIVRKLFKLLNETHVISMFLKNFLFK